MARHEDIAAAAAAASVDVLGCDKRGIAALARSVSPQGLVATCRFVDVTLDAALDAPRDIKGGARDSRLVVVAAHVREPGNAGSLVRIADATGAAAVVFAGSSVDPYNDKAVRASAGSLFHVPVVVGTTVVGAMEALGSKGYTVLAADAAGTTNLDALVDNGSLASPTAWIFGNEAWGIPADEQALADCAVAVPIYGRAESLNVATAAAICLSATAREQHRAGYLRGE